MSGHATLDSIRAIRELAELGIVDLSQDVRCESSTIASYTSILCFMVR